MALLPVSRVAGVATLAVAILHAGCSLTAWHPTRASPADLAANPPAAIRVLLTDGSIRTLHQPAIRPDSIIGVGRDGSHVAVAVADVSSMSVPVLEPPGAADRSALRPPGHVALGVGLGVVAALVFFALLLADAVEDATDRE
jgi:hypothetical protein